MSIPTKEGQVAMSESTSAGPSADVTAQIELLEEENRRLREEYRRLTQARHRQTAVGLAIIGVLGLIAAAVVPSVRSVLVVLGAIGLFGAFLTYFVTPERFVSATVSDGLVGAISQNIEAMRAELGLSDHMVYTPVHREGRVQSVRVFIPQNDEFSVPGDRALESVFVVEEETTSRGVSLVPAAASLVDEFDRSVTGTVPSEPGGAAEQLVDALVDQFELIDGGSVSAGENSKTTVTLNGSTLGSIDRLEHPVPSFLGSGIARWTGKPVEIIAEETDQGAVVQAEIIREQEIEG